MLAEIFLLQLEADIRASDALAGSNGSNHFIPDVATANAVSRRKSPTTDKVSKTSWRHPFSPLWILNGKV